MRIAMFTDCFLPSINGVVTSVVNASKKLAKKGHKIIIFTSENMHKHRPYLGPNIHIEYFRPLNLIRYPDFQLTMPDPRVIRSVMKFKPQVLHSHMPSFLGWEAVFCSKIFRIPLVGTYHTLLPDFLEHLPLPKRFNKSRVAKYVAWNYTRRYYNRCHMVTTPSKAMRSELKRHKLKRAIRVISNGVDLEKFKPVKNKKFGKTILYVGRVSYEKNIDVIINAFKKVAHANKEAKLLIAGGGPDMENLKKEAGSLLNKRIIFLGPVNHERLASVYHSADIFATASTIETEGLVILEAMACGLPIIGVNALAVPSIVHHGKNGFIAKPEDSSQIASYMSRLLDDKKLRESMASQSKKLVENYSLDAAIEELEEIYHSLAR